MSRKRKDFALAVQLYESGKSVQQIADAYGVGRQSMWKVLHRRGVQMRPHLRYGHDNHFWRGTAGIEKANGAIEKAVAKGTLIPKPCEVCGESPRRSDGARMVHAHHDDYSKPLEVRWLCQKHHHEWHKTNKALGCREVA